MNLNRIIRNTRHVFLYPFRYFPEGIKKNVMKKILTFQNSVPLYLVVNPGDTAIQIGTPHPRTVKRFSRLAGKHGKVFIVEADPENCDTLKKCIDNLKYKNVTLISKGAWSEETTLVFYKSDDFNGDNKIPVEGVVMDGDFRSQYSEKISINVDTLDGLLAEHGIKTFDYLSVTVNGAEYEVLKGAKNIISSSPKAMIYSKGHARINDEKKGKPINTLIKPYLTELGYNVIISKGEDPGLNIDFWKRREGDVFAWRT